MKYRVRVIFRSGGFFISETTTDNDTPATIAQRMAGGGFIVLQDELWGKKRSLSINLSDVQAFELTEIEEAKR